MELVSAVIATKNEAANIAACIASVADADEVIVADDGSEDDTVAIAKAAGAKVFRRQDWAEYATQEQVDKFISRFGWSPAFESGTRIRNGHLESREATEAAANDWVVRPDADERITWDLPRMRAEVLPNADQVVSQFVHSHKEDGSPERTSTITKMWRQSVTKIDGRTHTCILPAGRIAQVDYMRVDHYQKPGHTQADVLPILEYSVLVDDDQRSRFYLGREYVYHAEYEHALALLHLYLESATWQPEIQKARVYEAQAYWRMGQGDKAREAALQAVLLNPDDSEALGLMSELYFEPWSHKWRRIAERATNEDVLF
jgi:glycosyltransferase involved in cell wall biosynthesis